MGRVFIQLSFFMTVRCTGVAGMLRDMKETRNQGVGEVASWP